MLPLEGSVTFCLLFTVLFVLRIMRLLALFNCWHLFVYDVLLEIEVYSFLYIQLDVAEFFALIA